jgi:hypothetical protein
MLFIELDHGAVLRKESGLNTPKIVRLVIGNPLIMKEMAKRVIAGASDSEPKEQSIRQAVALWFAR